MDKGYFIQESIPARTIQNTTLNTYIKVHGEYGVVTEEYPFWIKARFFRDDKEIYRTFTLGDLVMLGLEPSNPSHLDGVDL